MIELGSKLRRRRESVVTVLKVLHDGPVTRDPGASNGCDRGIDEAEIAGRRGSGTGIDIEADDVDRPGPRRIVVGDAVLRRLDHGEGLAAGVQRVDEVAAFLEERRGHRALTDVRFVAQIVSQDGWIPGDRSDELRDRSIISVKATDWRIPEIPQPDNALEPFTCKRVEQLPVWTRHHTVETICRHDAISDLA